MALINEINKSADIEKEWQLFIEQLAADIECEKHEVLATLNEAWGLNEQGETAGQARAGEIEWAIGKREKPAVGQIVLSPNKVLKVAAVDNPKDPKKIILTDPKTGQDSKPIDVKRFQGPKLVKDRVTWTVKA